MTDNLPEQEKKITLPSSGLAEEILGGLGMLHQADIAPGRSSGPVMQDDRRPENQNAAGSLHLVGFILDREEYALDISQVQEIIRVGIWTRVPNAPEHVKGVVNLRGKIIPVLDLKVRMGLKESGLSKNARIVVVETGGKIMGILVDGVTRVLKLPLSAVEPPPEEVNTVEKNYIKGVGKLEGRLIILLDLAKVVGKEEKQTAAATVN